MKKFGNFAYELVHIGPYYRLQTLSVCYILSSLSKLVKGDNPYCQNVPKYGKHTVNKIMFVTFL